MKCRFVVLSLAIGCGFAPIAWTGVASAQDASSNAGVEGGEAAEPAPSRAATPAYSEHAAAARPSGRPILGAGVFLLITSYLPATAVAGSSDRDADQRLYIPVAGPWLDLAHRGSCGATCGAESGYRSLLVTDGILQGLGALMVLMGLADTDDPEPAAASAAARERVEVSPAQIGAGGYGLTAFGRF